LENGVGFEFGFGAEMGAFYFYAAGLAYASRTNDQQTADPDMHFSHEQNEILRTKRSQR